MPWSAPRYCPKGHGAFSASRCPQCEKEWKSNHEQRRQSSAQRGYDSEWRRMRDTHLRNYPTCVACGDVGSHVDHIIAHKGNPALLFNPSNLQTLCPSCHSRKTAKHDGAFGNATTRGVGSRLREGA